MINRNLLLEICREAGQIALRQWPGAGHQVESWEKEPGSPVCAADIAVDSFLKRELGALLPSAGWLSEETVDHPERLARGLCAAAAVEPTTPAAQLTRAQRKGLTARVTRLRLPITGNRGYNYAEVTAGGVPLTELDSRRMASRVCPDLYLCGEICDVDGRIGGFNFQWAWSSGYVAGISAAQSRPATTRKSHVSNTD